MTTTVKINPRSVINTSACFVILLTYAVIIGLRSVSVGADTITYRQIFDSPNPAIVEYGFYKLTTTIKYFTSSFQLYLLCISIITSCLFFLSGRMLLNSRSLFLFAMLLITFPFYGAITSNVIRQGLAISLVMLLFSLSRRRSDNTFIKLLGLVVGAIFHLPTALVMSTLLISRKYKPSVYIWFGFVGLSLMSPYYAEMFSRLVSGKYQIYLGSGIDYITGFRWQFALFSFLPIVIYILLNKFFNLAYSNQILSIYIWMNGLGLLFNFLPFYDRFLIPSWMLLPFLMTNYVSDILLSSKSRTSKTVMILLVLSITALAFSVVGLSN